MAAKDVRLGVDAGLFAAEAQPDQVNGPADSHQHAYQGENSLV